LRILVSIDDTDNLDSMGTGELASLIARNIERNKWGTCSFITRHQLLVHPDIPYTSHNSSMCFAADVEESTLESVIHNASDFLARESAAGSDPGLCVAVVERLKNPEQLIAFGYKTKQSIVGKDEAYGLAKDLGVHLSEHGGSGLGIIGALAGAALRLSGHDGRMRGNLRIGDDSGMTTVRELLAHPWVDEVRSTCGATPQNDDQVRLGEKVKTVMLDGRSILMVAPQDSINCGTPWTSCSKHQLRRY
jgi:hypothetical protein